MRDQPALERVARAAFEELGYVPRDNQIDVVVDVLVEYLGHRRRYVVLDAPTGAGKSIIGMAVSTSLRIVRDEAFKGSLIVTATNFLVDQYTREHEGRAYFHKVLGAGNYGCEIRRRLKHAPATADQCYRKSRYFFTMHPEGDAPECVNCEFARSRRLKNARQITLTNYAYYFLDRLYIDRVADPGSAFAEKTLTVFDEAHVINELFSSVYTVFFSRSRMEEYLNDATRLLGEGNGAIAAYRGSLGIVVDAAERNMVRPKNVASYLRILMKFYTFMKDAAEKRAGWSNAEASYDTLKQLSTKYEGLFCRADDILLYGPEVTTDCKNEGGQSSLTVKPVFLGELSQRVLEKTELVLFMSATITPELIERTMGLEDVGFVRADYAFEPDDKTIYYRKSDLVKLNATSLADPETYDRVAELVLGYASNSASDNGLVICSSFVQCEELAGRITGGPHDVMLHVRGEPLVNVIHRFRNVTRPTLLVSPSVHEGVDLPGELSRFQVLVKAPFASLGDRRVMHIMMRHRQIHNSMLVMKIVQALGRSTRFRGDKSVTYVIDRNVVRALNSRHNEWWSQFKWDVAA